MKGTCTWLKLPLCVVTLVSILNSSGVNENVFNLCVKVLMMPLCSDGRPSECIGQ